MKIFLFVILLLCAKQSVAQVPNDFFVKTYDESRKEFLRNIKSINNGQHFVFNHRSEKGSDLSTDIFYHKSNRSQKIIVLTSGVHGPEGFVGSSAMIYFLKEFYKKYENKISILLIHSLNPYGQKYNRRFTENNVDLNRNFSVNNNIYKIKNKGYQKLKQLLNPKGELKSIHIFSLAYHLIKELVFGVSISDLREGIVLGQYEYPKGIYFGGNKQEPITKYLSNFLPKILNNHKSILHIDFHTGLGVKGVMHILGGDKESKATLKLKKKMFPGNNKYYQVTSDTDKGFYQTNGDLITFMTNLSHTKEILSVAAEFGTMDIGIYPQIKTLNGIVLENQGYQYGFKDKALKTKMKNILLDLFYPEDKEWRKKVFLSTQFLFKDIILKFILYNYSKVPYSEISK